MVIGRNEGARLRRSLESLHAVRPAALYVDSASSDGSAALARGLGFAVLELGDDGRLTAARARNAGGEEVVQRRGGVEFVQFMDGDCALEAGWLEAGYTEMKSRPEAAVVFGRVQELEREASAFNRLCDIEWQSPVGEVAGCGGIALMRVAALRQVGAFDVNIVAGEDTELCARLRFAGWTIRHVATPMVRHDAAMHSVKQWWRRNLRAGYGFAQVGEKHRGSPEQPFAAKRRSNLVWAGGLPLLVVAAAPLTAGASLVLAAAYGGLAWKVYRVKRAGGLAARDARLYALHCVLAKFPQLLGQARYRVDHLLGRAPQLIEHKAPVIGAAGGDRA